MSKVTILLHFCCLIVALTVSSPLMAQTLKHVLELTYQNNPDLKVRRIQMRVADEQGRVLGEREQTQIRLLEQGLITKQTLLQTQQEPQLRLPGRQQQPREPASGQELHKPGEPERIPPVQHAWSGA